MKCILLCVLASATLWCGAAAVNAASTGVSATSSSGASLRQVEDELVQLTRQLADRRKAILQENPSVVALRTELDAVRREFDREIAALPSVAAVDEGHRAKLKAYGELEARFNRLRAHWTTHNKAPVSTNGVPAGAPRPFPGCPDCQKDFDRLVKGDPELNAEYQRRAAAMLAEMKAARAGLLQFTVTRRDVVNNAVSPDSGLQEKKNRIEQLESRIQALIAQDAVFSTLSAQRDACRARLHELGASRKDAGKSATVTRS